MRLSPETRGQLLRVAAEGCGVPVDEAVNQLFQEHWRARAVTAVDRYRAADREGWTEYLVAADGWHRAGAPILEPWDGEA